MGVSISWSLRDCIDISRLVVFYPTGHELTVFPSYIRFSTRSQLSSIYLSHLNTHTSMCFSSANACDQQDWHGIFLRFDRDDSGTIDRKELHAALLGFGFSLPPEMVKRLEKRFAPPPQPGLEHQKKGISFDRFLLACVTVKHYTEAFRK